jgi:hypothetical protein
MTILATAFALQGCGVDPDQAKDGEDVDPAVGDGAADEFSEHAVPKGEIAVGAAVSAAFDDSSHHLYDLVLVEEATVDVRLAGVSTPDLDTVVRVYGPRDASGVLPATPLAVDDDGGGNRSSFVMGQELAAGAYAVVASTYAGRPAPGETYRLEVACAGAGCEGGGAEDFGCEPAPRASWTVLIYGAYDCPEPIPSIRADLQRRLARQRNRTDDVRFVMLEDLTGRDNTSVVELTASGERTVWEPGELNVGRASTLERFVSLGRTCFPSNRVALYVVGHSVSALDGALVDYNPEGRTYMRFTEIRQAIERAGGELDVLDLGVCMSSSAELAYEFRDVADYLVGYQSFAQGYTALGWADALVANALIEPRALAQRMARAQAADGAHYLPQSLSVIDLSRIDDVAVAVDELAPGLEAALAGDAGPLLDARDATQPAATELAYSGLVDGVDWVDQTAARATDPALTEDLAALRTAISRAVVESVVELDEWRDETNPHDRSHGLSIALSDAMHPLGRFSGPSLYDAVSGLAFYQDTQLDELARAYHAAAMAR